MVNMSPPFVDIICKEDDEPEEVDDNVTYSDSSDEDSDDE